MSIELKLLTQEEERIVIAEALKDIKPQSMHTVGNITGKALKEAQAKTTIRQIVAWGNEICGHHSVYAIKKHQCDACWNELWRLSE